MRNQLNLQTLEQIPKLSFLVYINHYGIKSLSKSQRKIEKNIERMYRVGVSNT